MNTYKKHGGAGVLSLTRIPRKEFHPPEGASRPRRLT